MKSDSRRRPVIRVTADRMKLAIYHNLPSGGAKRALYEWTRRLARRHVIDEYTLSTADAEFCELRPHVHASRIRPFRRRRLLPSPFGRLNQVQRWRELHSLDRIARAQAAEIDAESYDLVFVNPCLFTTIPALTPYLRSRSLYFLHEPFGRGAPRAWGGGVRRGPALRDRVDQVDPLIRFYRRRLDRIQTRSLEAVGRLLANSRYTQSQMQTAYGSEAIVCPYGVDATAFRPVVEPADPPHVISVGELSPRKGFGFLIEALGCIPRQRRPRLVVACNMVIDSERDRVQRLAEARGVGLDIRLHLDTETLAHEYSRALICVYAPKQEPFGLVPLEAMACGRAVIGVREGGVMESVVDGQTGLLVGRDPEAFASAVDELLSDRARALEWGRNARDHVTSVWTWDRSVETLEAQFRLAA